MKNCSNILRSMTVLGLLLSASSIASASLTPLERVYEAMMISQGHDAHAVGLAFGADPSNTLTFTSVVDEQSGLFSYVSDPNQNYASTAFWLSASGSFDAQSNRYDWTATGTIGSRSFARSGSILFSEAPDGITTLADASSAWHSDPTGRADDWGTIDTVITSQEEVVDANGNKTSTCKYNTVFKRDGITTTLGSGTGTDEYNPVTEKWKYRLRPWLIMAGPPLDPIETQSESTLPAINGQSAFTMNVNNPEPSAAVISMTIALGAAMRRRRGVR